MVILQPAYCYLASTLEKSNGGPSVAVSLYMWSDELVKRKILWSGGKVSEVIYCDLPITLHLWIDKPT